MLKRGQIHLDNIHTDFFVDGTFKSARNKRTIGAPRKRHYPVLFPLLPIKNKDTHIRFFASFSIRYHDI